MPKMMCREQLEREKRYYISLGRKSTSIAAKKNRRGESLCTADSERKNATQPRADERATDVHDAFEPSPSSSRTVQAQYKYSTSSVSIVF